MSVVVVVGDPVTATTGDCDCCGGSVASPCCAIPVPTTLYVTFGTPFDVIFGTITLVYDSGSVAWVANFPLLCTIPITFSLTCTVITPPGTKIWGLTVSGVGSETCDIQGVANYTVFTCDPFLIMGSVTIVVVGDGCCISAGSYVVDITVSDTPP